MRTSKSKWKSYKKTKESWELNPKLTWSNITCRTSWVSTNSFRIK